MRVDSVLLVSLGVLALATAQAATRAVAQVPTYISQWGSAGTGDGQFMNPVGVAINASGEVYVADQGNHRIQKFSGAGVYLLQWELPGGDGYLDLPEGLATDAAGNLYVGDSGLHRLQKFSGSGVSLGSWLGSFDPAFGWELPFVGPVGVAVDASGEVYVADAGNGYVQKFTGIGGHNVDRWIGSRPSGVAIDPAGDVYVPCSDNTVRKFTSGLTYLNQWGARGSGNGQFDQPRGVAVDAFGTVYVADSANNRIQMFSGAGEYLGGWGSAGSGDGQFLNPVGVAINAAGEVYVTDQGNQRIQKFGFRPTPTVRQSFGALKARYR